MNKASNPYPVLASTYACKKSDFIVRLREPLQRTFVLRFEWPIQQPEWNSSSVSKVSSVSNVYGIESKQMALIDE